MSSAGKPWAGLAATARRHAALETQAPKVGRKRYDDIQDYLDSISAMRTMLWVLDEMPGDSEVEISSDAPSELTMRIYPPKGTGTEVTIAMTAPNVKNMLTAFSAPEHAASMVNVLLSALAKATAILAKLTLDVCYTRLGK